GEEPDERTATAGGAVADRPAEHRVPGLEGVEHGRGRDRRRDDEADLAGDAGQRLQVGGEHDPDRRPGTFGPHGSVWTSTDSTAGRSVTIGAQWSPPSADT